MRSFFDDHLLPWVVHRVMSYPPLLDYRRRTVRRARGRVLELGVGSGLNLPLYGPEVEEVVGVDLAPGLLERAQRSASELPLTAELVEASAEALPFAADSFDSVVVTWSLCSITDPGRALAEARRVLRPGGRLSFVEHGKSPEPSVARWQERLTPAWRTLSGGCHLNRTPERLVSEAGLELESLEAGYLRGPKLFTWMVEGSAVAPR